VSHPPFTCPLKVRYLEVDQQGVVFNMWYLAYFDDAMTAFLVSRELPYKTMVSHGYDIQVVHTEIDWHGSLGANDSAEVRLSLAKLGRTSFILRFDVASGEKVVASANTVYVVVATDGTGKRTIPEELLVALESVSP